MGLCPSGRLLPGIRQFGRHTDALRRKRDDLVTALSFSSPQVATDRLDVIIEPASVIVSNRANFLNDGIFPHDQFLHELFRGTSRRGSTLARRNRPDLEEHRHRLGAVPELTLEHFQLGEAVPLIE